MVLEPIGDIADVSLGKTQPSGPSDNAEAQMLARRDWYAGVIEAESGVEPNVAQALGRRESPERLHPTATALANPSRGLMLARVGHPTERVDRVSGVSRSEAQYYTRRTGRSR